MRLKTSRGDTIIEVLLAITVFSMVAVGAIAIMNQGTNAAQRALEITLVRQQIDAQAEALRAAQQVAATNGVKDGSIWKNLQTQPQTASSYSDTACPNSRVDVANAFIIDPRTSKWIDPNSEWLKPISAADPPYAQVSADNLGKVYSYGMWIEHRKTSEALGVPGAYNFTIRACWYGAGLGSTPQQLQTIVRLYDPS